MNSSSVKLLSSTKQLDQIKRLKGADAGTLLARKQVIENCSVTGAEQFLSCPGNWSSRCLRHLSEIHEAGWAQSQL